MKIAIASDDGQQIAQHTGRCGCFVIYEIDAGQAVRREERANRFTAHALGQCDESGPGHNGEHHHQSHDSLLDNLADCQVLVSRGMGPRLVVDLTSRGIRPFFCNVESVEEAAQQFAAGKLLPIEGAASCCHQHGGRGQGGCGT